MSEKILLSVFIVIAFFGVSDFLIYSIRSSPKSATLGLWFWVAGFFSLIFVVYYFI